ncbi:MAG: photosystem P840 reaction-center cytochrome c-551 [Planctomycetes bacterium]|nr:photosystem P840 reaction-center cytochrome c-551 [Planctomycetota bacterium]
MRKLFAVLACACLLAAGCATTSRWDAEYEKAPEPVRTDWALTKQRCGRCHTLEKVFLQLQVDNDRQDVLWTVEDMARKPGSGITRSEVATITDTLEWYRAR